MKTEQRTFKMHANLLFDVIRRQAGTLDRAVIEGIMNAVDAGAKEVHITVDPAQLVIADNGNGFQSREQIVTCFETFGQPHTQGEKKVFGAFRMGRGQLFAFGQNKWESGNFRMDVDIANLGLDYELVELPEPTHEGCRVTVLFYNTLNGYELGNLSAALKRDVTWLSTAVYLNGKRVSRDPAKDEWDEETPEAYIRYHSDETSHGGRHSVDVYNMGVFVRNYVGYYERGATVVTKKPLTLNFSRNDIMAGCPIWKPLAAKVLKEIKKKKSGDPTVKTKITEYDKRQMAAAILAGKADHSVSVHGRLYIDVTGKQWSASMLHKVVANYRNIVTSTPKNHAPGVKMFQLGLAFVLSDNTLVRFGVKNVKQLVKGITAHDNPYLRGLQAQEFSELESQLCQAYQVLGEEDLKPELQAYLEVFRKYEGWLRNQLPGKQTARKIVIGKSGKAVSWGDGETYIALDIDALNKNTNVLSRLSFAAHMILHEYCHTQSTLQDHDHAADFWGKFGIGLQGVGQFIEQCLLHLPHVFEHHHTESYEVSTDVAATMAAYTAEAKAKEKTKGKGNP